MSSYEEDSDPENKAAEETEDTKEVYKTQQPDDDEIYS